MEKRRLGFSDLYLSVLGMGCWQYGGGKYWGPQNQKDVDEVVHRALDLDINYFDTAEVYNDGESERSLGTALKGIRHKAIIGTKVTPANTSPSVLRQRCEDSLRRLQSDYIDLYMVHWPITPHGIEHFTNDRAVIDTPPSIEEAFGTLSTLQKEGKIRYIGISNHGVKQMNQVKATGVQVVANELAYNLFSRGIEEEILPHCVSNHIGAIGYMPLQQGLLSGKYKSLDEIKPMQARSRHFHHVRGEGARHHEEGAEEEIVEALSKLHELADQLKTPISVFSLAWVIANRNVATTIVGSRNIEQLKSNLHSTYYQLSSELYNQLNEITKPILKKLGSNPDYYENRYNSRIE
ncbi:aldo/keto reductase [Cohnella zeiphila]|uniref:Aldo/keto reductase n=1 Tax=Cohnella zeiphila TaxID=2761120 RepID=A0A7X0VYA6_9BACL|nr:aldo/keto reductase [Cohnella zeiphila]MBB6732743.1 aldo/keto reductase [Cohnella zeiphila]